MNAAMDWNRFTAIKMTNGTLQMLSFAGESLNDQSSYRALLMVAWVARAVRPASTRSRMCSKWVPGTM